jgi:exopolysaccharide biosynthesis protein
MAMAMDGGGSSTLVVEGEDGSPRILNTPIDNYIPGRERPVGNHLGIYIE